MCSQAHLQLVHLLFKGLPLGGELVHGLLRRSLHLHQHQALNFIAQFLFLANSSPDNSVLMSRRQVGPCLHTRLSLRRHLFPASETKQCDVKVAAHLPGSCVCPAQLRAQLHDLCRLPPRALLQRRRPVLRRQRLSRQACPVLHPNQEPSKSEICADTESHHSFV